jgi:hypothetical protein
MHNRTKRDMQRHIDATESAADIAMGPRSDAKNYSNVTNPGQGTGYLAVSQPQQGRIQYNY